MKSLEKTLLKNLYSVNIKIKNMKRLFILSFLFISTLVSAQDFEVPKDYSFLELEDYENQRNNVIKAVNWLENTPPSAATLDYVNRINQISEEKPELLVAHAYTRYLGDLSGGQILKKIAQRGMGLEGSEGLAFYEFNQVADESQFKINYKAALDSLPIKENEASQIIAEANIAFTLNMNIFSELEFNLVKFVLSKIRGASNAIQEQFLQLKKS